MANTNYVPGPGNSPFGNLPANPQGSFYATESGYTTTETNLIQKAIAAVIYDAAPAQYNALKVLSMKAFEDKNLDEFEYLESTFGRSVIEANAGVAGAAAAPGVPQTQTIPLTAASMAFVTPGLIIVYPDNTSANIISVGPGNQIVVESRTSDGLSAILVNDEFSIQSTIEPDGANGIENYERLQTITRYNYIQFFIRAQRWSRVELQKYKNAGTTNYLERDKAEKLKQIRVDMFNCYFNGIRGEFQTSFGIPAKSMGGIYPTMVAAGSMSANVPVAGLQAAFEQLAFATNYKAEGAVRFVYATDEMLNELYKIYIQPFVRYAPNDDIAKLNLREIHIGTMKFVLVPCELFRERSCFPAEWRRKLLIIDQEAITPVKMKGIPQVEMGSTLDRQENGTRENFKDWWVAAQMSIQFNNPVGSFWIDVM